MPANEAKSGGMIVLTLKEQPSVPLEAEVLCPDMIAGLAHDAVCGLPVFLGKRQCRSMTSSTSRERPATSWRFDGDARNVKWIGRGMTRGRITIEGNAGMHLGAYMKGGTIEVTGNASDWVGAEMIDGLIRIRGNAGGQVGAAYRGSSSGMQNGAILIERLGRHRSRHADETRHHRGQGPSARFRRPANERRDHLPDGRRRDSHRCLDGPRHDRLDRGDPAAADVFVCLRLQSRIFESVYQALDGDGIRDPRYEAAQGRTSDISAMRAFPAKGKFWYGGRSPSPRRRLCREIAVASQIQGRLPPLAIYRAPRGQAMRDARSRGLTKHYDRNIMPPVGWAWTEPWSVSDGSLANWWHRATLHPACGQPLPVGRGKTHEGPLIS